MKPRFPVLFTTFLLVVVTASATAQNPNSPLGSMTVNGAVGPPYPIVATIPSPGSLTITVGGLPGMPYLIAHNPLLLGALVIPGTGGPGFVDIALVPPPTILFDGFSGPFASLYTLGAGGMSSITLPIPAGLVGPAGAIQAVVAAPTPAGIALTAATDLHFSNQSSGTLAIGTNGSALLALSCPFTFYGSTWTSVYVNANGNLTFGASDASPVESSALFLSGPPRIAPFWHPLDPAITVGSTPPSISYVATAAGTTVTWSNVVEFVPPGGICPTGGICVTGPTRHRHTFAVTLGCNGAITFNYAVGQQKSNRALVGVSPGGSISGAAPSNLSLSLPVMGASYAAIHELFVGRILGGITGVFDFRGESLTFTPSGPGGAPTTAYTLTSSPIEPRIDWMPPVADGGASGPIKTLRGAGFLAGSTVQYRVNGTSGWSAMPATYLISSEEIWFTNPAYPTLPASAAIDVRVAVPGAAPAEWLRAMNTGSSMGYGFGTVNFGIAGANPVNSSFGVAGQYPVFYGTAYANTTTVWINKDGYVTLGGQSLLATGTAGAMVTSPARIAALWTDLEVPSFQQSAPEPSVYELGTTSATDPNGRHTVYWRAVPEWPDAGLNTFSIELRGASPNGQVTIHLGPGVIHAEAAVTGISPGYGSAATTNLSSAANAFTSSPGAPIFEVFDPSGAAFDLQGAVLRFVPANAPVNTAYSLLSP